MKHISSICNVDNFVDMVAKNDKEYAEALAMSLNLDSSKSSQALEMKLNKHQPRVVNIDKSDDFNLELNPVGMKDL